MTGMVAYSRKVTWHQAREPLILLAQTSKAGTANLAPTPEFVFIPPPAAVPVRLLPPAPITVASDLRLLPHHYLHLFLRMHPPLRLLPSLPLHLRRRCPLRHKLLISLSKNWATRETRTMRGVTHEADHQMGSLARMSPGAYTSQMVSQESINEARREHGLSPNPLDFSTTHASNLPTPKTLEKADGSEYSEIWRNSRVCEFGGLLQAHTFEAI